MLIACDVKVCDEMGWSRIQNGLLLDAAEASGFHVLLSGDQTIPYEQNMTSRKIALVCISDNHLGIVREYAPAIATAIEQVQSGEVRRVYCGTFARANSGNLRSLRFSSWVAVNFAQVERL